MKKKDIVTRTSAGVGATVITASLLFNGCITNDAQAHGLLTPMGTLSMSSLSMAALSAAELDQKLREAGYVSDKADEAEEFQQVIELYTPLVEELRAMVAASPDDWRTVEKLKAALGYLAEGYLCLGRFDQATALAEEGLALDDKANKFLHALLVFSYAGQGNFSKARSHRRKCDVWSSTLEELGDLYSNAGRECTDEFKTGVAERYIAIAEASRRAAAAPGGNNQDQIARFSAESAGSDAGSSDAGSGSSSDQGQH